MIKKVLIANRGEIAIRIMRTCKMLDIPFTTVYSTIDSESMHRLLSDESVCIGPPPSKDSYLNIPSIISAAKLHNCNAIHPGYGFLSENYKFAEICKSYNLIFIGPSPETLKIFGNKSEARELANKSNVPVLPGSKILSSVNEAISLANEIGYPVILKSCYGGGGKGLRVAWDKNELKNLYEISAKESVASFNNPSLYLEKYLLCPKHIEVQFAVDNYGNILILGDRDCSFQRRHQKLVEEAPVLSISEEERMTLYSYVKNLLSNVNYSGVGTAEFLYENNKFYFIEVNARLQVEHGVTEMLTGIDIVALQFLIANNEKIPYKQSDIKNDGHAIECRIIAEDPYKNFISETGTITRLYFPGAQNLRIDTHVYSGYTIPEHYDSLVAKIIVKGKNRAETIKKMKIYLKECIIEGINTTTKFFINALDNENFIKGNYSTKIIDDFDDLLALY